MNRHVNAIAGRLSLRPPQRRSLEMLDRITEIAPPRKGADAAALEAALEAIRSEFPSVTDFEREFPSLCFALATGVGKTRLMGAFISYLHLAHGINNFFVLAPNLTIYNKLIADFTPNTPKYVFKGIAEFATDAPALITGDNYEAVAGSLFDTLLRCKINIFNISKINSEVRGGKSPRIKRLSEYIGESYFDYLAGLPDLVLLMDESHRYRASAGIRAINELKPILGLELTATPFLETGKGAAPFKNVIFDYPLGRAMADGFVKEPAVVTRKNFNPAGMSAEEIERLKLEDGIRLHESVKVDLETYARETDNPIVKPFLLVIARDTTHAGQLLRWIQSDAFFEGRYKDKVIQVDSSRTGAEEEEMIERLLKVEHSDEPTEIVIHVNMLKEGWDVTNLYTIVPLRAANARILIEQSIGRGLRLPYGKRTGVTAVDRLNIVAHDRFQEIIDAANQPDSAIRMQAVVLDPDLLAQKTGTVVSQSQLATKLGLQPAQVTSSTTMAGKDVKISKGFTELKPSAYTYSVQEPPADYRVSPSDKTNMTKYLFGGFNRCLYPVQKFDSDAERKLAAILEREATKWFKPAKGQFQIFYRQGADHLEYQPDFVAETVDTIYMLEPKASNQLNDPIVLAKKDSAIKWCRNASAHAASYHGKPWRYVLIPHDAIADNMTLGGLAARYGVTDPL